MIFICPNCVPGHPIDTDKEAVEYHPKNEQREFVKCPGCKRWIEFDEYGFVGEY